MTQSHGDFSKVSPAAILYNGVRLQPFFCPFLGFSLIKSGVYGQSICRSRRRQNLQTVAKNANTQSGQGSTTVMFCRRQTPLRAQIFQRKTAKNRQRTATKRQKGAFRGKITAANAKKWRTSRQNHRGKRQKSL